MNRRLTNRIRFMIDELLPPFIRDKKFFMYPFYRIWFRGYPDINEIIFFKNNFATLSQDDFEKIYNKVYAFSTGSIKKRLTDLNEKCLAHILENIPDRGNAIIDVGCGRGYFLDQLVQKKNYKEVHGCDVLDDFQQNGITYTRSNMQSLAYADSFFDTVVCSHTLEHVLHLSKAVTELIRITNKQLIITVPCQRFYKYTLDLHINFFPLRSYLINAVGLKNYSCINIDGDLVYIGYKD